MTHQDPDQGLELDDGPGQGGPPKPPRQTQVNVTLTGFDAAGKAQFTLQPTGNDPLQGPNGPDQTLTFYNQDQNGVGHNGVDVAFVLTDNTGGNYAFPPNNLKAKAISSQMGPTNGAPPQGTNQVLSAISVGGQNNNTLRVHNANQNLQPSGPNLLGTFSYVLWVTNDNGVTYKPLDPGGNNMNGPIT